jgi:hypothetical protein
LLIVLAAGAAVVVLVVVVEEEVVVGVTQCAGQCRLMLGCCTTGNANSAALF